MACGNFFIKQGLFKLFGIKRKKSVNKKGKSNQGIKNMKKTAICVLSVLIIGLTAFCLLNGGGEQQEYLRIHIRANSNSEYDQSVKLKVRDKIVDYLTPALSECKTKSAAETFIKQNLESIEGVADKVLKNNGYKYTSTARVLNEKFPTRVYKELTLSEGYYDALIVYLDDGEGDNWWCVVYPPLCFTEGANYIYRSKIMDIINEFTKKSVKERT